MQTRANERVFAAEDFGDSQPFELDVSRSQAPIASPSRELEPHAWFAEREREDRAPTVSRHLVPQRTIVPTERGPFASFVASIPMEVWKRVAVYPPAFWLLLYLILPCRLSPRFTLISFAIGIAGAVGAYVHHRTRDRVRLTTFS